MVNLIFAALAAALFVSDYHFGRFVWASFWAFVAVMNFGVALLEKRS